MGFGSLLAIIDEAVTILVLSFEHGRGLCIRSLQPFTGTRDWNSVTEAGQCGQERILGNKQYEHHAGDGQ